MAIVKDLGIFFRFGQVFGLFPYRMAVDRKFKRFDFSWFHPLTFWFISALICQYLPLINTAIVLNVLFEQTGPSAFPKPLIFLGIIVSGGHYVMILVGRAVTLRYGQLRSVLKSLSAQVVLSLEEFEALPRCHNSFKKRSLIGLIIILTFVIQ